MLLTASLNYLKGMKKSVFCQLSPSPQLVSKYNLDELNQLILKPFPTRTTAVITPRWVTSNQGKDEQVWGCSIKEYEWLRQITLRTPCGTITLIRLPANVRHAALTHQDMIDAKSDPIKFAAGVEKANASIRERVGDRIWDKAFKFQQECVRFCIAHNGRALIADDMGLGKTIEAMITTCYYKEKWPCLIVTPAKCRSGWMMELTGYLGIPSADVEIINTGADLKPRKRKATKAKSKAKSKSKAKVKDDEEDGESKESKKPMKRFKIGREFLDNDDDVGGVPPTSPPAEGDCIPLSPPAKGDASTLAQTSPPPETSTLPASTAGGQGGGTPPLEGIEPPPEFVEAWSGWFSRENKKLPSFTIVSFDLVALHLKLFKNRDYRVVVVDESHHTKNSESKRSKSLMEIVRDADHALLVTGTPLTKTKEVHPAASALYPHLFSNFFEFANRYCDPKTKTISCKGMSRQITTYDGRTLANELHVVLASLMMIRRSKAEVKDEISQLPPKTRSKLFLDPDKKRIKLAEKHASKVDLTKITVDEKLEEDCGKNNAFLEAVRKICKLKLPFVERYLDLLLDPLGPDATPDQLAAHPLADSMKHAIDLRGWIQSPEQKAEGKPGTINPMKILLFGHHKQMLDSIETVLQRKRIGFVRLDGCTPPRKVFDIINNFQNDPVCRVALLSITAACAGITLTAANAVVFLEMHASAISMLQAEDRAHRIGQKLPVHCRFLMFPGSVEEIVWSLLNNKVKSLTSIADGDIRSFKGKRIDEDSSAVSSYVSSDPIGTVDAVGSDDPSNESDDIATEIHLNLGPAPPSIDEEEDGDGDGDG